MCLVAMVHTSFALVRDIDDICICIVIGIGEQRMSVSLDSSMKMVV